MSEEVIAHLHRFAPRGQTDAVVIVLHGGRPKSFERSQGRHLSVVRMWPFVWALHRMGEQRGAAVWFLRYRYRGWNDTEVASPVQDALWALSEVKRLHGDVPVILVGHSMGARTALAVAGEASVQSVVALAPWLPPGESVVPVKGKNILILHGSTDRWTDPRLSLEYARRAEGTARSVTRIEIQGAGHFMAQRIFEFQQLTVLFVQRQLEALAQEGSPGDMPSMQSEQSLSANHLPDVLSRATGKLTAQV